MASVPGPSPSSPLLNIWAATYTTTVAMERITLALIKPDSSLWIETDKFNDAFGDPWPGKPKSSAMVYQSMFRPPQLLISSERIGQVSVVPESSGLAIDTMPPPPDAVNARIQAIVYGRHEVCNSDVYNKIYQAMADNQEYPVSNESLGGDTWPGISKTCTVFYTIQRAERFRVAVARQHGSFLKFYL
ncbi:hypothetical protein MMC30_007291 [Trapelia coarctata]|nr:hypothetical protein [Trapelia coarctata]